MAFVTEFVNEFCADRMQVPYEYENHRENEKNMFFTSKFKSEREKDRGMTAFDGEIAF